MNLPLKKGTITLSIFRERGAMDITYIREFLTLTEHLNYTTAAQALYVSQPTLSRHIYILEEELGVKLLNRTRHAVELTKDGEVALKSFRAIVKHSDKLYEDIGKGSEEGIVDIRLGMVYYGVSAFYGYPLLKAFAERHPEVRISVTSSQSTQIYDYLHRGMSDVILSMSSSYYATQDIKTALVARIPLYAVVLPDHPLAKRHSISVEELAEERIILNPIQKDNRVNYIEELFLRHGVTLKNIEHTHNIDTMLITMENTGGVFVGSMLLSAIPLKSLEFIPIESEDFTIDISLSYASDSDNPHIPKLIKCIDYIRKPSM